MRSAGLALSLAAAVFATAVSAQDAAAPRGAGPVPPAALDAAIDRGAAWIRAHQRDDGAVPPAGPRDVCPLALTAVATWGLAATGSAGEGAERGARFLALHRRADGGIYDPSRGLAVYTSGVAARALRALGPRSDWPELAPTLAGVELFTYRRGTPESILDATHPGEIPVARAAEVARALLADSPPAEAARRRALEFLARSEREPVRLPSRLRASDAPFGEPDAFSYDDLLRIVTSELAPEHQIVRRARAALALHYTPDRNPDLTKRYGERGFEPGTQGLFYYYLVTARTLTTFDQRELVTADGVAHDWASELCVRLVRSQRADGSWSNVDPAWWEDEPVLATSYALLTLDLCRRTLRGRESR